MSAGESPKLAAEIPIKAEVQEFSLDDADQALAALKARKFRSSDRGCGFPKRPSFHRHKDRCGWPPIPRRDAISRHQVFQSEAGEPISPLFLFANFKSSGAENRHKLTQRGLAPVHSFHIFHSAFSSAQIISNLDAENILVIGVYLQASFLRNAKERSRCSQNW